jgi:hypothetical protein
MFLQLRPPTLNHRHLNRAMKIRKQLPSLRRNPSNKQANIATHWPRDASSITVDSHFPLMDSTRSAVFFHPEATAQHATRHVKLKLTLYIIVPKKGNHIVYDLSIYILLCLVLLFVLYATSCIFFICCPIMLYVFLSLRFGLHCFYPRSYLKNGRM